MAHVFSNYGFDVYSIDISQIYYNTYNDYYLINQKYNGIFYRQVAVFDYTDSGVESTAVFGGFGFTFNTKGAVTGGTVTGYLQVDGNVPLWGIEGINYSAKALYSVGSTTSRGDDFAVVASVLSGNDTFDMSFQADIIRGFAGNDVINGNGGNDALYGDSGNDLIRGSSGNDILAGGMGFDTLIGGSGQDSFLFDTLPNTWTSRDTIVDFSTVDDVIFLDRSIFTKLAKGELKAGNFVGDTSGRAHDSNDYIIYQKNNGALYYDSNGSASGGLIQLATLTNKPTLTFHDFVVI